MPEINLNHRVSFEVRGPIDTEELISALSNAHDMVSQSESRPTVTSFEYHIADIRDQRERSWMTVTVRRA